jgi:hypothetical protein
MSTAPAGPDPSETEALGRWEYHTFEAGAPLDVESLDALGRDGWRLAAVVKYEGMLTYTFIRPAKGG